MKYLMVALMLTAVLTAGCKRHPSRVSHFSGPISGIIFTEEVWEESGGYSSDFTSISASFEKSGQIDKIVIIDGPYLRVSHLIWTDKNHATVCLLTGRVNTFKSSIELRAGGETYNIVNNIDFNCPNKSEA